MKKIFPFITLILVYIQSCATVGKPAVGSEVLIERRPQKPPLWIENWHAYLQKEPEEFIPFVGISREFSSEQDAERDALQNIVEKISRFLSDTVSIRYQGTDIVNSISSEVINPKIIYKKLFKEQSGGIIRSVYPEDVYVKVYKRLTNKGWRRFYKVYILLNYPRKEIEKFYKRIEEELNLRLNTMLELYSSGESKIEDGKLIEGLSNLLDALKIKKELGIYAEKRHIDIKGAIAEALGNVELQPIPRDSIYAGKKDRVRLGVRAILIKNTKKIPLKSLNLNFKSEIGKLIPPSSVTNENGEAHTFLHIPSGFSGKVIVYCVPSLPEKLNYMLSGDFENSLKVFELKKLIFTVIHERKFALFKVSLDGDEISEKILEIMQRELGGWMKIVDDGDFEYQLLISSRKNISRTEYYGTSFMEVSYIVNLKLKNSRTGENYTRILKADGIGGTPDTAQARAILKIKKEIKKFIKLFSESER